MSGTISITTFQSTDLVINSGTTEVTISPTGTIAVGNGTTNGAFAVYNNIESDPSASLTIENAGLIEGIGKNAYGIEAVGSEEGAFTLINTGTIDATRFGIDAYRPQLQSDIDNEGLIAVGPASNAIALDFQGYLTNASVGTIQGLSEIYNGSTLENDGTLSANGSKMGAIYLIGGDANLILDPDSVIIGSASFSSGTTGTLLLGGTSSTASTLANDIPTHFGGAFTTYGFATNAQRVMDATSTEFSGTTLANLLLGDTLDLTDISADSATYAAGALTLYSGSTLIDTLTLSEPQYVPGDTFSLTPDGQGGSFLTSDVTCFCAGTRILTPNGEVPVEILRPGDLVITASAQIRPIIWAGRERIHIAKHPEPELVRPIRITAGALGLGLPERDLRLSPHHAVQIGGELVEAKALINGSTIYQERDQRAVTYHHLELPSHDILLAEGTPCESYRDTGMRLKAA